MTINKAEVGSSVICIKRWHRFLPEEHHFFLQYPNFDIINKSHLYE